MAQIMPVENLALKLLSKSQTEVSRKNRKDSIEWIKKTTKIVSEPGAALVVKTCQIPPWIQERINKALKARKR